MILVRLVQIVRKLTFFAKILYTYIMWTTALCPRFSVRSMHTEPDFMVG